MGAKARITAIGIGDSGVKTINRLIDEGVGGIRFVAANTNQQSLSQSKAKVRVQLGYAQTQGLGAGGSPEMGRHAAEASADELYEVMDGAEQVFILTSMGGGTGTGAAPVIAEIARRSYARVSAIVGTAFTFEGAQRQEIARAGAARLKGAVDTFTLIPGDRLLKVTRDASMERAFNLLEGAIAWELISRVGDLR